MLSRIRRAGQSSRCSLVVTAVDDLGLNIDAEVLLECVARSNSRFSAVRSFDGRLPTWRKLLVGAAAMVDRHLLRRRLIVVHLENFNRRLMRAADVNVLVPNQEWFRDWVRELLESGDVELWCKTRYAHEIFAERYPQAHFVGFCSRDLLDESIADGQSLSFLHVAGKSRQKGTATILDVWGRHPEWPELVVVCRLPDLVAPYSELPNVRLLTDFVPEAELAAMMNRHAVHLCLSETEGFGHYLHEAMSTGAIVVTTDGPPMSEFVDEDSGFLVAAGDQATQSLSNVYFADADHFEQTVGSILQADPAELQALSANARRRYELTCEAFGRRLDDRLTALTRT